MNGAQWLVRTLVDCGVEQVFVLCGNGLDPLLDAFLDYGLRIVDVRNEQAAAYMADTWARLTGRLGVAAVSSGPGHTNALTGLANSWWDGGPMLLISGSSSHAMRGQGAFQELDQVGMAAPVCKYAAMVHSAQTLVSETQTALTAATTSRPGPAHLTIPEDVLSADVQESQQIALRPKAVAAGAAEPALVSKAMETVNRAKRPVLIVGSGAFYAGAWPELKLLADVTGIPLFTLLWDRGCIEEAIPEYVGVVSTEVNAGSEMIARADVIVTVGARVDFRLGHGSQSMVSPDARFVRIDADPAEVDRLRPADIPLVGNPRTVLGQMNAEAGRHQAANAWLDQIRTHRRSALDFWDSLPLEDCAPMPSPRLCREVRPFLQGDVTFLLDGGNIGRWAHLLFFDRHPSYWFTCGISGVVGWGIPGAVAAKLARPAQPLLLLSGDGSAGFTLAEIHTAVRLGISYVAVIAHDSAWGIVADKQPPNRRAGSQLGEIRFDRVARSLGACGVFVDDARQIAPAIEAGLRSPVATFIHVPTTSHGVASYRAVLGGGMPE